MKGITYQPAWWLPGGHLMTLGRQFMKRPLVEGIKPLRLETADGDFIDVLRLAASPTAPRLLVLHGLEGSGQSRYLSSLFAEMRRMGWGMDVLVFRSCGGEPNRTARFYHSGETGDLAFVLEAVMAEFPEAPFALAGFSLGGNVMLKWLGEMAGLVPERVMAAVAVSVPFDLARSADRIGTGFSKIYERHFLRSLKRKARAKARRFPSNPAFSNVERARTIREFDDLVTAPLHGFRDAADYYAKSSSLGYLASIRVPTLLLSAIDDPFLPADVLREASAVARENRVLETEFVKRGGHVGFVTGKWPWRAGHYAEQRIAEFCADMVLQHRNRAVSSTLK